jgi:hypothetical protein
LFRSTDGNKGLLAAAHAITPLAGLLGDIDLPHLMEELRSTNLQRQVKKWKIKLSNVRGR